jgi:hypothetical protein
MLSTALLTLTCKKNKLLKAEGKNKKILIITDAAAATRQMAEDIAAIIGDSSGFSVLITQTEDFSGTSLLPAYAFFVGCENPHPSSFSCIEAMFDHINLAGRLCGIFSSNPDAVTYLSRLVCASEAAAGSPLCAENGKADKGAMQNWIRGILRNERV